MLFVVFGLKAALLPLHFWLPAGYGAAAPPVAALFAIMTKVGAYAILRLSTVVFGAEAGDLADLLLPWLLPAALLTLWFGMIGALGSKALGELAGFLLIASIGTLLTAFALGDADSLAAGLYYLAQSVPATAALFLLVGLIAEQRGERGSDIAPGPALHRRRLLGFGFLLAALALIGLPPLGGFLGKAMLLQSVDGPATGWIFSSLLLTGLLGLIACSRAGVILFWTAEGDARDAPPLPARHLLPALALLGGNIALTLGAAPVAAYSQAAAAQILDPAGYHRAVLGNAPRAAEP
jgi:multicomponent K+:H+ antiporter subunit D